MLAEVEEVQTDTLGQAHGFKCPRMAWAVVHHDLRQARVVVDRSGARHVSGR